MHLLLLPLPLPGDRPKCCLSRTCSCLRQGCRADRKISAHLRSRFDQHSRQIHICLSPAIRRAPADSAQYEAQRHRRVHQLDRPVPTDAGIIPCTPKSGEMVPNALRLLQPVPVVRERLACRMTWAQRFLCRILCRSPGTAHARAVCDLERVVMQPVWKIG